MRENDPESKLLFPIDEDFTLSIETLKTGFPEANGLKYKPTNSDCYHL